MCPVGGGSGPAGSWADTLGPRRTLHPKATEAYRWKSAEEGVRSGTPDMLSRCVGGTVGKGGATGIKGPEPQKQCEEKPQLQASHMQSGIVGCSDNECGQLSGAPVI